MSEPKESPNDDRDDIQVEDEVEINVIRSDETDADPSTTDPESNEHAG